MIRTARLLCLLALLLPRLAAADSVWLSMSCNDPSGSGTAYLKTQEGDAESSGQPLSQKLTDFDDLLCVDGYFGYVAGVATCRPATSSTLTSGDKGPITVDANLTDWHIDTAAVTKAMLEDMPTATVLGRNTAGTGVPENVTMAQLAALLGSPIVKNNQANTWTLGPQRFVGCVSEATACEFGNGTDALLVWGEAGSLFKKSKVPHDDITDVPATFGWYLRLNTVDAMHLTPGGNWTADATTNIDYGTALSTKPVKAGATLPATCHLSDLAIDNDATDLTGQLYLCTNDNNDTWTRVGGTSVDDAVLVGNGTTAISSALPSCSNATTSKLLYNTTTNAFSCGTDQGGAGSGDFVGPASSTDNAPVRFDGTTGKLGQNTTTLTIADDGTLQWTDATLTRFAANVMHLRNSTTSQKLLVTNTYTDDTHYEGLALMFASNVATIKTETVGNTARVLALNYANSTNVAISIPVAVGTAIDLGSTTTSSTVLNGMVRIGSATHSATSGSVVALKVGPTFASSSTSTTTPVGILINPTINYSNGTPGAAAYSALQIDAVETALGTGTNLLINARAGTLGTTAKFTVTNGGVVDAAGGYKSGGTAGVTVTTCTQFTLGICTAGS